MYDTPEKANPPTGGWGVTLGLLQPGSSITPRCETGEEHPPNTRSRRPSEGHNLLHSVIESTSRRVRSGRCGDKSKADPAPSLHQSFGGSASTHPVLSLGC